MTGTGTQNDPYIVDNWEDFTAVTNASKAEIYVKWADFDNKIIDFNDIKPEGFSKAVYFPANCDFNGWILKNFSSTANTAIAYNNGNGIIENLIFENIYITSSYLFYGAWELKKCQFSGRIQRNDSVNVFSNCGLNMCAVNFIINTTASVYLLDDSSFREPKAWAKFSDIVVDISTNSTNVHITKNALINCRVSGKVEMGESSYLWVGGSSSASNVINLESKVKLRLSGGISVFNSDIATTDSPNVLIACTAEQLKNPEYLASIGFPIGVD